MKNTKKLQIGVIGYAGVEEYPKERAPKKKIYEAAEQVGFLLAKKGGRAGLFLMRHTRLAVRRERQKNCKAIRMPGLLLLRLMMFQESQSRL